MRYDDTDILRNPKRYYSTTIYPKFEARDTDIYIISNSTDRLDLLANTYYQDPTMWWVIAKANNIGKGTLNVEPGIQIRIPYPLSYVEIADAIRQTKTAR